MAPFYPTLRTFYRLRRELIEVLGVDRRDVRPSTRLEALVPRRRRRVVWQHLRRRGLELPDLGLSPRADGIALTGTLVGAALLVGWTAAGAVLLGACVQGLLALVAMHRLGFAVWLVSRPFADHICCGPVTVRDAVLYLTPYKGNKDYPWSHEEIATKVRLIISVSLGIRLEEVRPELRFVEDLGC
ncbi:MAG: hypothetical protein HYS12_07820 [Planctomycetes bacterium]|nr:hypothetical protein [Planctomycetota bacterium]